MPTQVTESAVWTLLPGAPVEKALKSIAELGSKTPGFQSISWGYWEESSDKVQLFVNWETLEAHKNLQASEEAFAAVKKLVRPLLAAPPSMHHVDFNTRPPVDAPVLELVTLYSISETLEADFKKFIAVLEKSAGFVAAAYGEVVEALAQEAGGEAGKAYSAAIGWESIEAHLEAMKTDAVGEALGGVVSGVKGVEFHHVRFQSVSA